MQNFYLLVALSFSLLSNVSNRWDDNINIVINSFSGSGNFDELSVLREIRPLNRLIRLIRSQFKSKSKLIFACFFIHYLSFEVIPDVYIMISPIVTIDKLMPYFSLTKSNTCCKVIGP